MNARTPPRDVWAWRFGAAELDESRLELRVGGEVVAIEPKPLEFLMCLLRHSGEVVTKEELLEALWTGRVVTESVLTSCAAKARQALRDDAHQVIRTVHGYGYRLVAEVVRESRSGPQRLQPPRLQAGDAPPLRPQWRLVKAFDGARGETWLAEHAKSGEKRVLKFAFDAPALSALKREITVSRLLRETLGPRDDHVRLLDWNLELQPYFLEFEHCAGGNLVDWFGARGAPAAVPLATRLHVVASVADALAAAHASGVLHKDIKPANILVDGEGDDGLPHIRLADFGSGGIVDVERLRALNITGMGFTQNAPPQAGTGGTWAYMAPEVLTGQPPTVRSDVFSVGVLLHQLAVGDLHRPLAPGWERDIDDELLREDVQACCDTDPAKRIGDVAEIARRLRSLPERRLERERARAAARDAQRMAEALQRSRARRPWLWTLGAVGAAAFALTLYAFVQVDRARGEVEAQAAAARAVNDYLVHDLLAAANPMNLPPAAGPHRQPGQVPLRELLDRAAAGAAQRFAGQPQTEAAVRMSLGEAYAGMAAYREAAEQFLAAHDRLPGDAPGRAAALHRAGSVLREADDYEGARRHLDAALALVATPAARGDAAAERLRVKIRQTQGWLLYKEGRYADGVAILQQERPALARAFGEDSEESATAYTQLSNLLLLAGDLRAAEAAARRAVEVRRTASGEDHPRMVEAWSTLVDVLRVAGKTGEAEAANRTAFDLSRRLLGPDHPGTLVAQGSLATLLQDARRYDEAIVLFEDVLRRSASVHGEVNYETSTFANNLGLAYADAGRTVEAIAMLERALASGRALLGDAHPEIIAQRHNLADVLADAGRWDEALALEQAVLEQARAVLGPRHLRVGAIQRTLGRILAQRGRVEEARSMLLDARAILLGELPADHPQVRKVDQLLADIGHRAGGLVVPERKVGS